MKKYFIDPHVTTDTTVYDKHFHSGVNICYRLRHEHQTQPLVKQRDTRYSVYNILIFLTTIVVVYNKFKKLSYHTIITSRYRVFSIIIRFLIGRYLNYNRFRILICTIIISHIPEI